MSRWVELAERVGFVNFDISVLTEVQLQVIEMRFGDSPKRLSDVGAELGLSRERVRQIEARSIQRLRKSEL